MRNSTHALLIAVFVATSLAAGQPAFALTQEQIEELRLLDAKRASRTRKEAAVRFAYAEKCETAFSAGEPMPERDLRLTETVEIDEDLMGMSVEEISAEYGIASDGFYEADRAVNACIRKFRKRNDGS